MKIKQFKSKNSKTATVLALGSDSRPAVALHKGKKILLQQDDALEPDYEKALKALQKKIRFKPEVVLHDNHPYFLSRRMNFSPAEKKGVFHHRAHFACCLWENDITEKALGVTFDGTGFGEDYNVWGGEIFLRDGSSIKRVAHLEYVAMPGNEAAIREPWRMAFSYLHKTFGKNVFDKDLKFFKQNHKDKCRILSTMIERKINSPLTSSMGRLFDAACALMGDYPKVDFQAQAAIHLENLAKHSGTKEAYTFEVIPEAGTFVISARNCIRQIIQDVQNSKPKALIAKKFHNAIINMLAEVLILCSKKYKTKTFCFSGGVFYNEILKSGLEQALKKEGKVAFNSKQLLGDQGIALGQIAYYLGGFN